MFAFDGMVSGSIQATRDTWPFQSFACTALAFSWLGWLEVGEPCRAVSVDVRRPFLRLQLFALL